MNDVTVESKEEFIEKLRPYLKFIYIMEDQSLKEEKAKILSEYNCIVAIAFTRETINLYIGSHTNSIRYAILSRHTDVMYRENKVYYTEKDFENAVQFIKNQVFGYLMEE